MADRVWGPKDPDAIRDFANDWTDDIGDETIATSTWKLDGVAWPVDSDLVKVSSAIAAGNMGTIIRISGGVAGTTYLVTNHVVLSNGEEDDWSQKLKIKER